jgi:Ca-activated chloride channel homolog
MRSTIKYLFKGVATMRFFVAFFLVLTMFSSGAVTLGQNAPRRTAQTSAQKPEPPPSDTIKICQGVPLPAGYVVVAYLTSAACPHGAYLLKKQNNYESSLAVNGDSRQMTDQPSGSKPASSVGNYIRSNSPSSGTNSAGDKSTSRTNAAGASSSSTSPATRPRVVASASKDSASSQTNAASTAQPNLTAATKPLADNASPDVNESSVQGPPSLIGGQSARSLGAPTLANAGAASSSSAPGNPAEASTASSGPEEVSAGDVVKVNTSIVTVPVSVLDRQGRFVPNLQKDDFRIFDNGVEQSIAYFEPAEKPFTVALLLDTSASTHFHLQEIREAAIAFAKQLRPQDRMLVVTFNDEVLLLTPNATNDLNTVEDLIDEFANTGSSTRLYDAVHLTIRERLNQIKGRKAIVLFTDGVDTSSQQSTYQTTLREAEELDALIYPIQYDTTDYARSMQGGGNTVTVVTTTHSIFGSKTTQQTYNAPANNGQPMPGTSKADYDRADKYLHALADETGGRLYQANDTKQLADAFSRIAEELRRQYSLGYYPKSDSGEDNARREIKVRVKRSDLAVKARDSYSKSSGANPNK